MKKLMLSSFLAGVLLLGTSASATMYKVDASHTNVGFKIKHMMISTVTGKFQNFSGEYDLTKGQLKSFNGTIKASSIDTGVAKRDDHLRSADFFDVSKYQDIKFVMTSASKKQMTGNMTMHGVTKKVVLNISSVGTVTDPWGNNRSAFILTGKINRKDFGLTWNTAIESGGVVVGDEVQLEVEIEGIEAE